MAAKTMLFSFFFVLAVAAVALASAGDDCSGPANTLPIYDKVCVVRGLEFCS